MENFKKISVKKITIHEHDFLVDQEQYFVFDKALTIANGATQYYIIEAIDNDVHFNIQLNIEGKVLLRTYGNPTGVVKGAEIIPFNRVFPSNEEYSSKLFPVTSVADKGIARGDILIPAGVGGTATGGSSRGNLKSIVKKGNSILVEIDNESLQARDGSISIDCYEKEI